jgi:glyoxylate/hydroxypyruvate reductase A
VPRDVPLARMVDPAMNEAMAETALWAVLACSAASSTTRASSVRSMAAACRSGAPTRPTVGVLGLGQMGRAPRARLVAARLPRARLEHARRRAAGVDALSGEAALAACSRVPTSSSTCCR